MSINKYQHRYTEPPPCILSRRVGSRSCDFTARWKLHAVLGRPVVTGPRVLTKSGVYADTHVPFTHRPSTCVQMHTHDPLQRHTDGPTLSERPPVHTSPRLPLHSPLALPSPTLPRPRDRPSCHTHFQLCPRHGPLATGPASASFPLEEVEGHRSSPPPELPIHQLPGRGVEPAPPDGGRRSSALRLWLDTDKRARAQSQRPRLFRLLARPTSGARKRYLCAEVDR